MSAMDTVAATLQMGALTLRTRSASPRLDAELLLSKVLGMPRTALLVRAAEPMSDAQRRAYEQLIARRAHGEPIPYLTGSREFWSLDLTITPDVLVPRPETELLVELALERIPADEPRSILDLGTGSGAVALAIAAERPGVQVTGVDVSSAALAVAAQNSRKLALTRVRWRAGSWFESVPGERFDLIVANPPYIAADDPALAALRAEPILALTCGPTGLEALAHIIGRAMRHLNRRGAILLEHGCTQADEVAGMLERGGFAGVRSHDDYSGKPRVTVGNVDPSH
jgi:release factor glutamine methyltransferase